MYEHFYGFAERPFSLTPDPKFLYRSAAHSRAFESLQIALDRGERFMVVTGDIGTGKTTLCRALRQRAERRMQTALLINPFLTEEDLIASVLRGLGVRPSEDQDGGGQPTRHELIGELHEHLLTLAAVGARVVVFIDEAQNLAPEVIEQVRVLTNLESPSGTLLQVVLVGQLSLLTLLRRPELLAVDQRISLRCQLEPFGLEETMEYINHRLHVVAPSRRSVEFTERAFELIHTRSKGVPRLINLICDRALLGACAARQMLVTSEIVSAAIGGLELPYDPASGNSWLDRVHVKIVVKSPVAVR